MMVDEALADSAGELHVAIGSTQSTHFLHDVSLLQISSACLRG
jgi:hypothetical protein